MTRTQRRGMAKRCRLPGATPSDREEEDSSDRAPHLDDRSALRATRMVAPSLLALLPAAGVLVAWRASAKQTDKSTPHSCQAREADMNLAESRSSWRQGLASGGSPWAGSAGYDSASEEEVSV